MGDTMTPTSQLVEALVDAAWRLRSIGLVFADPHDRIAASQIRSVAEATCAALAQDADDKLAAEACLSVMTVLWPHGSPEDVGEPGWWRTPLGRLCARSLGRDDTEAVTHSVAAAMLGVTRGTVAQMVHRGTLDRHPDGGVLRASVLQRLAR